MRPVAFSAFPRFSSLVLTLLAAGLLSALPGRWAMAQDAAPADIETAPKSAPGIVNANSISIRSGPTDSSYSTMKLNKGQHVTVVGARLDWLKIVPPDGSFCYVGKLYVERHGDGTQGRITKDKVNIRAGSEFNTMAYAILCEAPEGLEVTILGEHDEYFKIKPPPGAYLYINKQYVDPDETAKPQPIAAATPDTAVRVNETSPAVNPPSPPTDPTAPPASNEMATAAPDATPTTNPTTPMNVSPTPETPVATAVGPATQANPNDTPETAQTAFAKAEADWNALNAQPLEQQTIAPVLETFQSLAINDNLPDTLRRIAEARVTTLKNRIQAIDKLANIHKEQEEMQHQQLALKAETEELRERLAKSTLNFYAAVGELHPSSLQVGSQTLYRLTDPATGRTVCYVRTDDTKFVNSVGQFVGIKGEVASDDKLNAQVVTATSIETVDPNKVNNGVAAQIIPPSLLPKTQASGL